MSSRSQASAMKGVMMMRKSEYGGAGLGIVRLVTAEGAGVFSRALAGHAVAAFTVPPEAVLATVAVGAYAV